MKKLLIATFAFCSLLMFSCKKDYQPHALFIGATIKNSNWVAQPSTNYFANGDSLMVKGTNATDYESVIFNVPFKGVGTYQIRANQASFGITAGPGEGPTTIYRVDTTQTNTVTFTSFDIKTNIATGSFQLHFKGPNGSDNIDLINGSFWIQTPAATGQ